MTVITRTTDWVKILADKDMMAIEAVLTDIYTARCVGLKDYVLFDGGAHKGYHTTRMAALPGCEAVYAVEADPYMLQTLDERLSKAVCPGTQKPLFGPDAVELWVVDKALQNDPAVELINWKSSVSHVGRSSIGAENSDHETIWSTRVGMEYRDNMTVAATTIDKVLSRERRDVPFVKLDLEGADILSLFGAETMLRTKRPVVVYENSVHAPRVHGFTIKEFSDYLSRLGYVSVDFAGLPMLPERWFGFFEAWLAPPDQVEWLAKTLHIALDRQARRLGIAHETRSRDPGSEPDGDPSGDLHLFDTDVAVMAVNPEGKGDVPDFNMTVTRRFWTNPHRDNQPVEAALGQVDWNQHGEGFCVRVRQVLKKLEDEGLRVGLGVPKVSASNPERQWMLDSGRMAWLLWLSARRKINSQDEAAEKLLWAEQSDAYRLYVRNSLHALEADGIIFARDLTDGA